jgi:hypothetical protein
MHSFQFAEDRSKFDTEDDEGHVTGTSGVPGVHECNS